MSAFDKIGTDRVLQDHWLRRLIAAIIDSVLMAIIAWIITFFAALPVFALTGIFVIGTFPFLSGILLFLYAWFMEFMRGATFGKQIMNLKATTLQGNMPSPDKALLINISKIHPVLWIIDTLVGMALPGDPHQKYSDRWMGTTVISTIDRTLILPAQPSTSTLSPTPPSSPSPPAST